MIKERLAEPSNTPSAVKKMLVFVVFAELLGYEAEFAHIHAVKLAQRGSVAEKKMGKVDVNNLHLLKVVSYSSMVMNRKSCLG